MKYWNLIVLFDFTRLTTSQTPFDFGSFYSGAEDFLQETPSRNEITCGALCNSVGEDECYSFHYGQQGACRTGKLNDNFTLDDIANMDLSLTKDIFARRSKGATKFSLTCHGHL